MQYGYVGWLLAGVGLVGPLLGWVAETLFARWCYHTGVDRRAWWGWGVVGWATQTAYWFLVFGLWVTMSSGLNPFGLALLGAGGAAALFVVLRFRLYWRRRGG